MPERKRKRFSEIMLSSSNFPTLRFSQGLSPMLSKRRLTASKWKLAKLSEESSATNETFFQSVPAVQRSIPDRSKPCDVSVRST